MKAYLELGNQRDKGRRERSEGEGEVWDLTEELSPSDWLGETELSETKQVKMRNPCIHMVEVEREVMDMGRRLTSISPRLSSPGANGSALTVGQSSIS